MFWNDQIKALSKINSKLFKDKKNLKIDIMILEKAKEKNLKTIEYLEQDLQDSKSLLPVSTQKFMMLMLNQSRGTTSYNSTSLLGYLIFASLRNRFAMGISYLIKEMDKLNQQRLEYERKLKEIPKYEDLNVFVRQILLFKLKLKFHNFYILINKKWVVFFVIVEQVIFHFRSM